jgi:hypothetical protein
MILVVTTNGIFVIDTSLYHAPIILMLDGKVITQTVSKQVFDGVAEISQTNNNKVTDQPLSCFLVSTGA